MLENIRELHFVYSATCNKVTISTKLASEMVLIMFSACLTRHMPRDDGVKTYGFCYIKAT